MTEVMDATACLALAMGCPIARLATTRSDGRADLVPVVVALIGDAVVFAVDHKPKTTTRLQRLVNIEANPEVTLLFDHYEDDWTQLWWVRARGQARVLPHDDEELRPMALDALQYAHPQYADRRPEGPVVWIDTTEWKGWRADLW